MSNSEGMTLRIDVAERLRHLPWELLYTDAAYLSSNALRLFTPARLVTEKAGKIEVYNRPLRTLYMACSAQDVEPLLDFEAEEGRILEAARRHQIELFVEESGSLDGLSYQVVAFGRRYFDVFHLTGHASVDMSGPRFLMENDQGLRQDVSAEEIAEAFQGDWPRLVFLSGCRTGQSPQQGYLPSFSEALVQAGAPAVLGWALPVNDLTANLAAGELYGHLAAGKSIDEAVARATSPVAGKYPGLASAAPLRKRHTTRGDGDGVKNAETGAAAGARSVDRVSRRRRQGRGLQA
jgi:CHAT domain-containing protein